MTQPILPSLEEPRSSRFCCPIVELRQYTLHPGKRDVLIDLFDREFVETQEATGIKVIGQFKNVDDPDHFVWLRGFDDMASRAKALQDFYGGPVWKAHRETANATMINSDNVLLLRPARSSSGFPLENMKRPPVGVGKVPSSLVVAAIYYFEAPVTRDFIEFFEHTLKPAATSLGGRDDLRLFCDGKQRKHFPCVAGTRGRKCLRLVLDLSGSGRICNLRSRSLWI
jgi:NIPSNAP